MHSDVKGENLLFTTKSALFYGNTPRCDLSNHGILFLTNKQGNKLIYTTIKKRKKKKEKRKKKKENNSLIIRITESTTQITYHIDLDGSYKHPYRLGNLMGSWII